MLRKLVSAMPSRFYNDLLSVTTTISSHETLLICGDLNGHIGEKADGFEGFHGGCGIGSRNSEGERILEFATANNLVVTNSFFKKRESHLVTYRSGLSATQIDYILMRKSDLKLVKNVKCISGEECAPQHKLLISDLLISALLPKRRRFTPKCRIWKLRHEEVRASFQADVAQKVFRLAQ